MSQFNVIVIGGRPAGASLAIRLAQGGLKVLVVDRATFPSKPAVPSMPLILPHTLDILGEVGISEADVAECGTKLVRLMLEMAGQYAVEIDFKKAMEGDARAPYFYSIKRDPFDLALWNKLADFPNITALSEFGVSNLLQEDGKVIGIEGSNGERHTADLVIGADGRFSFVADRMNAEAFNEVTTNNTDFYFAYWKGGTYDHADAMHTMHVYSSNEGYQTLIFPVSEGEVAVGLQMVHDRFPKKNGESIDDYYLRMLKSYPVLWKQIANAEQVSQVWGVRNVRNGYRQVGGEGWALVGDAVHFKDSIDGQGIYDALLSAKLLAPIIVDHLSGKHNWVDSLAKYRAILLEQTYDMFMETQGRLQREIHSVVPPFVLNNILRRVMQDPIYQQQFVGYATRRFAPKGWASPPLMLGALVRGIGRDLRKTIR